MTGKEYIPLTMEQDKYLRYILERIDRPGLPGDWKIDLTDNRSEIPIMCTIDEIYRKLSAIRSWGMYDRSAGNFINSLLNSWTIQFLLNERYEL